MKNCNLPLLVLEEGEKRKEKRIAVKNETKQKTKRAVGL